MVVGAQVGAVGSSDTVNHSRFKIGDEDLLVGAIERHVTERRPGVCAIVQSDVGEDAGPVIIGCVEAVDRTGTAAGAP